jgi:type IX secretion system PorP/SprF family membrane protein
MPKRLLLIPILLFLLRGGIMIAQDPVFSQFYASPLQLNPAFAGNAYAPFIALNYRMQYPNFLNGAAYSTFAASYDQFLNGLNSGIGFSLMTDDAGQGILRKNFASAHYAYKVAVNDDAAFKIGVEAGMIQTNLNWSKLTFGDQLDPTNGNPTKPTGEAVPASLNRSVFDLSTGVLFYSSGFYIGVTAKHLATPNEEFIKTDRNLRVGLPIRWNVHGGYEIILRKATRYRPANFITPSLMVVKQGDFAQVVGGAYGGFGPIIAGAWYRQAYSNPDAFITMIGFKQDYFKIAYSYDYQVGQLGGATGGSHEISLTINLDPYSKKKFDPSDCFKMFR